MFDEKLIQGNVGIERASVVGHRSLDGLGKRVVDNGDKNEGTHRSLHAVLDHCTCGWDDGIRPGTRL